MARSIGAVLLGWVVTALVVGPLMGMLVAVVFRGFGATGGPESPVRELGIAIATLLAIPFGGWTTARVAGRSPLIHSLLLGLIFAIDLVGLGIENPTNEIRFVVFVSAAMLGGWIASRRRGEVDRQPPALPYDA